MNTGRKSQSLNTVVTTLPTAIISCLTPTDVSKLRSTSREIKGALDRTTYGSIMNFFNQEEAKVEEKNNSWRLTFANHTPLLDQENARKLFTIVATSVLSITACNALGPCVSAEALAYEDSSPVFLGNLYGAMVGTIASAISILPIDYMRENQDTLETIWGILYGTFFGALSMGIKVSDHPEPVDILTDFISNHPLTVAFTALSTVGLFANRTLMNASLETIEDIKNERNFKLEEVREYYAEQLKAPLEDMPKNGK